MKLAATLSISPRMADYLERYVNDGSPSGYTLHDQMSAKTNPLGLEPYFHPLRLLASANVRTEIFPSTLFDCPEPYLQQLIHPDAAEQLSEHGIEFERAAEIRLVPTSSGRTCRLLDDATGHFVKLHYPGRLGRIDRSLPHFKAVAGIEVSDEMATAIADNALSARIAIFPEVTAVTTHLKHGAFSFGHVVRRGLPFPVVKARCRIPLFSLWSFDRLAPLDAPLFEQLHELDARSAVQLAGEICDELIDFVLDLWSGTGLLYEVNSQNILVELNQEYRLTRLVVRDFNSTEKDVSRRNALGRDSNFAAGIYKLLPVDDPENAVRRRSFTFDFKLCHYAVAPLLTALRRVNEHSADQLMERLRDKVDRRLRDFPADFLPTDGTWWSHPEVDLSSSRPYVQNQQPMLR